MTIYEQEMLLAEICSALRESSRRNRIMAAMDGARERGITDCLWNAEHCERLIQRIDALPPPPIPRP